MIPLITLTTDFGADSPYVAQMKGAILSLLDCAQLIDITHSIPPQDVFAGALALHDACPVFPARTIHVAVVDPGVGTERKIVALRAQGCWYIAPDNGLLTGIVERGPPEEIRYVENRGLWRPEVSSTFHGRDILAPTAAHLAMGLDATQLGPRASSVVQIPWPRASFEGDVCRGEVVHVDSFGNLVTNIFGRELAGWVAGQRVQIEINDARISGLSRTYGDQLPGQFVALIGSSDRLEIAQVNGHAARQLGVGRGASVWLASE
jgi:S-adenosylmethionine hydrolase